MNQHRLCSTVVFMRTVFALLFGGMLVLGCSDDGAGGAGDAGLADSGPPPPGEVKVGVARLRMPVPLGIGTVGYAGFMLGGHPSPFAQMFAATNRVHAHPQFRAAVISRGPGHEVIFLRSDTVGTFQQFRRAVVLELNKRLGRDVDHALVFGGTHTHSGPGRLIGASGLFDMIADSFFPEFYVAMVAAAADVVQAAYKDLKAGRVGYTVTRADAGQNDRRCEDGETHVNGTLPLLVLQQGTTTVGLVFSYAVHGTSLSLEDLNLSREVSGAIEEAIEDRFDHPVEALFFNSWGADISPASPKVTEQSGATQPKGYDKMERVGYVVAQAAHAALGQVKWQAAPTISLRTFRVPINRKVIGYKASVFPYEYGGLYCGQNIKTDCDAKTKIADLDQRCIPFTEGFPAPNQTEITVGRIGALRLVTFPGEPGTKLAEKVVAGVKQKTGATAVMFIGYTQDYLGYSILEDDWWQGGYEAGGALWGPRQGEYLTQKAIEAADLQHQGKTPAKGTEPAPVAAFTIPKYAPYVAEGAKDAGTVITAVTASYKITDTVVFTVAGSDPWLGTPVAHLETASGAAVKRKNGRAVTSDGYAFYIDMAPTPSYKAQRKATQRTFAWKFSMPAQHKVPCCLPALSGKYRLRVVLPVAGGKTKDVISKVFAVTP